MLASISPMCIMQEGGRFYGLAEYTPPESKTSYLILIRSEFYGVDLIPKTTWEVVSFIPIESFEGFKSFQDSRLPVVCTIDVNLEVTAVSRPEYAVAGYGLRYTSSTNTWIYLGVSTDSSYTIPGSVLYNIPYPSQGSPVKVQVFETFLTTHIMRTRQFKPGGGEVVQNSNSWITGRYAVDGPLGVSRLAYGNDTLYYYYRNKDGATLTIIPLLDGIPDILNSPSKGTKTIAMASTKSCESNEFASVLNNTFYYLCQAGSTLQLHDQKKMIGSSLNDGIVLSFTLFDNGSPQALIHVESPNYNQLRGVSLRTGAAEGSGAAIFITVGALPSSSAITPPGSTPDPLPTILDPRYFKSGEPLPIGVGIAIAIVLLMMVVGLIWFRKRMVNRRDTKTDSGSTFGENIPEMDTFNTEEPTEVLLSSPPPLYEEAIQVSPYPAPSSPRHKLQHFMADSTLAPMFVQRPQSATATFGNGMLRPAPQVSAGSVAYQSYNPSVPTAPSPGLCSMALEEIAFSQHPRPNITTSLGN